MCSFSCITCPGGQHLGTLIALDEANGSLVFVDSGSAIIGGSVIDEDSVVIGDSVNSMILGGSSGQ